MAESSQPSIPNTIGRYQILEELGRGAMGVVYRGFDPNVGRSVAIKTVLLDQGDPETIRRFKREAQAAGILSHPGIVTIYDAGEDQGMFYIAMEFVEGNTLQARIRQGPLTMEQALVILTQVGEALDHAHSRQIIHRDVKPANIILTEDHAKIMDFGVAKITAIGITTVGTVMGTPAYMSPEAVQGHTVESSTDVFSLGVMFYEMVTGRRPFAGDSVTTVMYKIISENAAPVATLNSKLPPSLDPVFKKALAKSPKQRYQSCADLIRDARKALEGAPPAPGPEMLSASQQLADAVSLSPPVAAAPPAEPPVEPDTPSGRHPAAWPHGAPSTETPEPKAPPRRMTPPPPQPQSSSKGPVMVVAAVAVVLLVAAGAYWKLSQPAEQAAPAPQPVVSEPAPAKKAPKKSGPVKGETTAKAAPGAATKVPGAIEVLIKSNVEGATITVDGKTQPGWQTPSRVPLTPGSHMILVSKAGYTAKRHGLLFGDNSPREITVNLDTSSAPAGKTAEKASAPGATPKRGESAAATAAAAAAAAEPGSLRVLTEPKGATILVDGKKTDYKSPVIVPLPAGKHTIVLQHRRHDPVTREVVIRGGQIAEINVNLAAPK